MRAGIGADDALVGLAVAGPAARALQPIRLAPMVGGALRAALDCLIPESRIAATARVSADGSALEVRLDGIAPEGLAPAGGVLETVEGHVGRVPGSHGVWMVRVPVLALEETFLMVEQGDLAVAVPWHSVVRMRLSAPGHLRAIAEQDGYGVLAPLAPLDADAAEQPAVLLGLGLRRAWLAADRIIWRMAAEAVDAAPPRPGLGPVVRSADDREFVVYDAAHHLRDVALPPLPHVEPPYQPVSRTTGAPEIDAARVWPEPVPIGAPVTGALPEQAFWSAEAPEGSPAEQPTSPPSLRLVELGAEAVEPLDEADAAALETDVVPLSEGLPAAPIAVEESALLGDVMASAPAPEAPSREVPVAPMAAEPRRALVAEDSIIARIFLVRLLEQAGYAVTAVASGRDLVRVAARESWTVVFADVDLPDAAAGSALGALTPLRADGTPAPVVALVRDADDARVAAAAGVPHTLAKPYERSELLAVLERLRQERMTETR
jgi:CheY-like chemotaxis protein